MTENRKGRRWGARIVAFTLAFTVAAWLLPTNWQGANAAAAPQNPRTADGTTTWDCVYFGSYPQSSDGNEGFKTEKIKWRVLSVDGNDAFLLADQNLDCQQYNTSFASVTWATCTLRSWLNGYGSGENESGIDYSKNNFIDKAFTSSEQGAIFTTNVENADNPYYYNAEGGDDTQDKVYLLSIEEALETSYGFSADRDEYDETRRAENTDYAKDQGAWTANEPGYRGNGWWWLRSRGYFSTDATSVGTYGCIEYYGAYVSTLEGTVRPALHLNLDSDLWSDAGTVSVSKQTTAVKSDKPGKVTGVKAKVQASKKKLIVRWKKNAKADGYQVVVARDKNFKKGKRTALIKKKNATKKTFKKLKSLKKRQRKGTYYVKVRAYKKVDNAKVYGAYSMVVRVKIK